MAMDFIDGEGSKARRDLRREEMERFAGDIAWLQDPTLIPETAVAIRDPSASPYLHLSDWMIRQLAGWSAEAHKKLSYGEVFDRYDLTGTERVRIREVIQKQAAFAFAPGLNAINEIHSVVPHVATREGVDRKDWGEIARRARLFGTILAKQPTHTQALARTYLKDAFQSLNYNEINPRYFRLDDDTGITTVTPIDKLLATAQQANNAYFVAEDHAGICVALQVKSPALDNRTVFDAAWDAFSDATERLIYPGLPMAELDLSPPYASDEQPEVRMDQLARLSIQEMPRAEIFHLLIERARQLQAEEM